MFDVYTIQLMSVEFVVAFWKKKREVNIISYHLQVSPCPFIVVLAEHQDVVDVVTVECSDVVAV